MINCFINSSGSFISCKYWFFSPIPKAIVFISHGEGEHSLIYENLANELTKINIAVFSHDHIGHGKSQGERLSVTSFNVYLQDVMQHVGIFKRVYPNVPMFVLGHSMGSAIAILTSAKYPNIFDGVILLSPMINFSEKLSFCDIIKTYLCNIFYPSKIIHKINVNLLSNNKEENLLYNSDPYVCGNCGMSASFCYQMMRLTSKVKKKIKNVKIPIMVLHGTDNSVCDVKWSMYVVKSVKSHDITIKMYKGAKHDLHREKINIRDSVFNDIIAWLMNKSNISYYDMLI
ncbi:13L [Yaba monkey tumor virus]|uniref:13L n=1 Tax=Yaba monkey tumor virus (strain VR587) TaxID=928314 RepID=Q6TUZ7_YMTV5|nr:esterase/lipase [Yaba monkey tumor virus]AAR07372.1 13L [Yaba monkey tumor virus]